MEGLPIFVVSEFGFGAFDFFFLVKLIYFMIVLNNDSELNSHGLEVQ